MEQDSPYEKPVLIIKSNIRKWLKEKGFHCKAKSYRSINDFLIKSLEEMIQRTKLSKRKTLSPEHI